MKTLENFSEHRDDKTVRMLLDSQLRTDRRLRLAARLHELSGVVDFFVIVEADCTFSGEPKALAFDATDARLRHLPTGCATSRFTTCAGWYLSYMGMSDDDVQHAGDPRGHRYWCVDRVWPRLVRKAGLRVEGGESGGGAALDGRSAGPSASVRVALSKLRT